VCHCIMRQSSTDLERAVSASWDDKQRVETHVSVRPEAPEELRHNHLQTPKRSLAFTAGFFAETAAAAWRQGTQAALGNGLSCTFLQMFSTDTITRGARSLSLHAQKY